LKEEFQGSDRTEMMQALNMNTEFEVVRMKDVEPIK